MLPGSRPEILQQAIQFINSSKNVNPTARNVDEVPVAPCGSTQPVRVVRVVPRAEVEGGGSGGGVADRAVALLPPDTHLVVLVLQVLRGGGPRHVAVHAPVTGLQ